MNIVTDAFALAAGFIFSLWLWRLSCTACAIACMYSRSNVKFTTSRSERARLTNVQIVKLRHEINSQ